MLKSRLILKILNANEQDLPARPLLRTETHGKCCYASAILHKAIMKIAFKWNKIHRKRKKAKKSSIFPWKMFTVIVIVSFLHFHFIFGILYISAKINMYVCHNKTFEQLSVSPSQPSLPPPESVSKHKLEMSKDGQRMCGGRWMGWSKLPTFLGIKKIQQ